MAQIAAQYCNKHTSMATSIIRTCREYVPLTASLVSSLAHSTCDPSNILKFLPILSFWQSALKNSLFKFNKFPAFTGPGDIRWIVVEDHFAAFLDRLQQQVCVLRYLRYILAGNAYIRFTTPQDVSADFTCHIMKLFARAYVVVEVRSIFSLVISLLICLSQTSNRTHEC